MKRLWKTIVPIALAVSLLAGCSFGGGGNKGLGKDEEAVIKVMYYDDHSFYQEFGMLFSALNPNIDVQIVNTQSIYRDRGDDEEFDYKKAMAEFIEREKPDILMLDTEQYEEMALDGKLYSLESFMARDKYDTEGLISGLSDYMKELGGGQLYGFPSGFYSQALFYNKDLFDKFNIPHPTDQMTWDEVIQLARQFPTDGEPEDRVYGLKMSYSNDLNQISTMLASSEGLSYVNATDKKMTINTSGWKNVIQTSLDAMNSGALYFEDYGNRMMGGSSSYEDYLLRDPFLSGRLAMTIDGNYLMRQIKDAKNNVKDQSLIIDNYDMVTMPVSVQNPDMSTYTSYNNIFAIAGDSPNKEAAWKFLSYITGDEYARVQSKLSYNNGFPIRTKYIVDEDGRNLAAFYKLKPSRVNMYKDFDKLPQQFSMMFYGIMEEEMQAIKNDSKTIEEALEVLQVKGEELLLAEPMSDEELQQLMEEQMQERMKMMQEASGEVIVESNSVTVE